METAFTGICYLPICSFQLCFCVESSTTRVQISSKNGDREIQREEKRKIITALGCHPRRPNWPKLIITYILKWCIEYSAVIKQLLLNITYVEFLQLYTSKAEGKIYLGIAHCSSANVQGGFAG